MTVLDKLKIWKIYNRRLRTFEDITSEELAFKIQYDLVNLTGEFIKVSKHGKIWVDAEVIYASKQRDFTSTAR